MSAGRPVKPMTTAIDGHAGGGCACEASGSEAVAALTIRVRREFEEMPGLRLTVTQAARLFGLTCDVAGAVLRDLRRAAVLRCSRRGEYALDK